MNLHGAQTVRPPAGSRTSSDGLMADQRTAWTFRILPREHGSLACAVAAGHSPISCHVGQRTENHIGEPLGRVNGKS